MQIQHSHSKARGSLTLPPAMCSLCASVGRYAPPDAKAARKNCIVIGRLCLCWCKVGWVGSPCDNVQRLGAVCVLNGAAVLVWTRSEPRSRRLPCCFRTVPKQKALDHALSLSFALLPLCHIKFALFALFRAGWWWRGCSSAGMCGDSDEKEGNNLL